MSRSGDDAVGIGVCSTGLAMARGGSIERRHAAPSKPERASASDWNESLSATVAGMKGQVRVTLAPSLLRWMVLEPPAGVRGLSELRRYAALRFEDIFAEAAQDWAIRGDWRATAACLCVALPAGLAEALDEPKRGLVQHISTSAERTLSLAGADALPADYVWVEVVGGFGTIFWVRQGGVARVAKVRVDERHPFARIRSELQRTAVERSDEESIHWATPSSVAADVPVSWTQHRPLTGIATATDAEPACWAALLGTRT